MALRLVVLLTLSTCAVWVTSAEASSPYELRDGWSYFMEAVRMVPWPSCPYRFLSYIADPTSSRIDLWNGAGINQLFHLRLLEPRARLLSLHTSDGRIVMASTQCNSTEVRLAQPSSHPSGFAAVWEAIRASSQPGHYALRLAKGREGCREPVALAFPAAVCTTGGPDKVELGPPSLSWRFFAAESRSHQQLTAATKQGCPDPYAWLVAELNQEARLVCTGQWIPLFGGTLTNSTSTLQDMTSAIDHGVPPPPWANASSRWAPETMRKGRVTYLIFADQQPFGGHRIGYAVSTRGPQPRAFDRFGANYLELINDEAGDIDGHLFEDPTQTHTTYLIWKTDDNRIGRMATRLWSRRVVLDEQNASIEVAASAAVQLLNSSHLWWAPSFVAGGTLIEAPEMLYWDGYYYLFFAAGRYDGASYSEGVARSRSPLGPFDTMMVPFLSTHLVGFDGSQKIQGPGHGSIVVIEARQPSEHTRFLFVVAAHTESQPRLNRKAYVFEFVFDEGWPIARL